MVSYAANTTRPVMRKASGMGAATPIQKQFDSDPYLGRSFATISIAMRHATLGVHPISRLIAKYSSIIIFSLVQLPVNRTGDGC